MRVHGCDCSIVIKTAYCDGLNIPYSEETIREADKLCATIHNVCSVESLRSKLACTDICNALGVFAALLRIT